MIFTVIRDRQPDSLVTLARHEAAVKRMRMRRVELFHMWTPPRVGDRTHRLVGEGDLSNA